LTGGSVKEESGASSTVTIFTAWTVRKEREHPVTPPPENGPCPTLVMPSVL
jgi:hypothetical protein